MATLRLDETLQVFGSGQEQKGPVSYNDRWVVDNLILDFVGDPLTYPKIYLYRNFVEPRNLIMKSENNDNLNKTVNVGFRLESGENLVCHVVSDDPGGLVSVHIMGTRYVAMAGYNEQTTLFQGF